MVVTRKVTGVALLSLRLAAAAVQNCLDLITEMSAITGASTTTITMEADFSCETHLEISADQDVEIASGTNGPYTLSIGEQFAGSQATETSGGSSLLVNKGTLALNGVNFATETVDGNRAVYNSGTLSMVNCELNLFHLGGFIDQGGAVFSDSNSTVDIINSTFRSNAALLNGGAVYVGGSETVTITSSTFNNNEAGSGALGNASSGSGAGGDVWAGRDVELTVTDSTFSASTAEYGGAAIACCGAEIVNSIFSSTDVSSTERHFGAVMVGGPDEDACDRELTVEGSTFSRCSVAASLGEGGSLAIFDTTATLTDCVFEASVGTAVLFTSTSEDGDHHLEMADCQFNENTGPSEAYASETLQGAAVVVTNTGVSDGDVVEMGTFLNMICFANEPYECEFVYDGAEVVHSGEFKCHLCDIEGTQQAIDDDLLTATARSVNTDSSDDDQEGIIIGLAVAAALLALVVIAGFIAWKCKKSPSSDGAETAQPAPATGEAAAPTAPPAARSMASVPAAAAAAVARTATSSAPATTGTVEPAAQA